jgi:methionyl-tRNA formyltransferase
MRLIFWGTSEFAVPSLERINNSGHEICCVVTTPEKQAGRGLKSKPSPIKLTSDKIGLRVIEPDNPNTDDVFEILNLEKADVCVLAAYGFIIKPKLLNLPSKGFINIHPSLLPKYRGAAPIQRAVINGEKVSGVTTFFMNEHMDAGDIIMQSVTDIDDNETYGELQTRLAQIGADLVIKTLNLIRDDKYQHTPQDKDLVTLAPKIKKEECVIDWNKPAKEIHNLIRGLSPEPGAYSHFREKRVRILKSGLSVLLPEINLSSKGKPGRISTVRKNLLVSTQDGYLEILMLQIEGGKIISGTDFINGQRLKPEESFL